MAIKPTFRWTCSYLNCVWYEVTDETGTYEVELRRRVSDYERSITSYTDEAWERDVVAAIGILHRTSSTRPIPDETVAAFNEWQQSVREEWIAKWKANPDRYGLFDPTDISAQPFEPVKGGHYVIGKGWVVTYDPTVQKAA
jgi:hypothetical protein